jgi:hypothetical protein
LRYWYRFPVGARRLCALSDEINLVGARLTCWVQTNPVQRWTTIAQSYGRCDHRTVVYKELLRYSRQIPSEASFRLPRNTARLVVISTRGITTRPIGPSNHYVYQRVRVFLRRRHNVSSLAFVLSHGLHGSERGGVNFIRCAARLVLRLTHSSGSLAFAHVLAARV